MAWRAAALRVLLITSRETRRWIVPKGWPMSGLSDMEAAGIEALEEAGARGELLPDPIGRYDYDKVLSEDEARLCRVAVYPMRVDSLAEDWKEASERKRKWFLPREAAVRVREPDLARLLHGLPKRCRKDPVLKGLLGLD